MGRQRLLHSFNFLFGSRLLRPGRLLASLQPRTWLVSVVDFVGDNFLLFGWRHLGYSDRQVHRQVRRANIDYRWRNTRRDRTFLDALCRTTLATFCGLRLLCTRLVCLRHGASHNCRYSLVSCATGECSGDRVDRLVDGRHSSYTIY